MNIFEQFLNKISHKFPKGYPDMNNEQDISLLESLVSEVLGKEIKLNEADTGEATLFESALVKAWYEINKKEMPEDAIPLVDANKLSINSNMVSKAKKIIKDLGLQDGNSAYQTGRGAGKLTSFWARFGATNTTPKTDVILGDKKISVKVGSSQLMSGGPFESKATFYAALKNTSTLINSPEVENILTLFDEFFGKLITSGYTTSGGVEVNLKSNTDEILKAANEVHKQMQNELQILFNSDEFFKISFAQEAMSGYEKFGINSPSSADYILSANKELTKGNIHLTTDSSYVAVVANKMKLVIRFKSTSEKLKGKKTGRYRYWSVLSLVIPSLISEVTLSKKELIKHLSEVKAHISNNIINLVNFVAPPEDIEIDKSIDTDIVF